MPFVQNSRIVLRRLCGLLLFLAVLFLAMVPGGFISAKAETADELTTDEALRKIFKSNRASGAAVVVAKDGEIVYQYQYGWADKRDKEPISLRTYFRIASVTKLVSAIHVMQLVERGKLSLDTDIGEYLGYRVRNPYAKSTPITLRMLMTHTSSLSNKGGFPSVRNSLRSLISTEEPNHANWYRETPGSVYRYSNFGAGVMGSLIESVTGLNVNDSITESLFRPLDIDAAYAAGLLAAPQDVPDLYNAAGAMYASRNKNLTRDWDSSVDPDFHFRITVGQLWIRPSDLCRLGIMLCDGGVLDGQTVLRPETVAEMMADQQGRAGITADTPYGLCVHHETTLVDGKTLYGHQGVTEGLLCNLYFDPETRFVFVLCTNGSSNIMDHRVVRLTRRVFDVAWNTFSGT